MKPVKESVTGKGIKLIGGGKKEGGETEICKCLMNKILCFALGLKFITYIYLFFHQEKELVWQ